MEILYVHRNEARKFDLQDFNMARDQIHKAENYELLWVLWLISVWEEKLWVISLPVSAFTLLFWIYFRFVVGLWILEMMAYIKLVSMSLMSYYWHWSWSSVLSWGQFVISIALNAQCHRKERLLDQTVKCGFCFLMRSGAICIALEPGFFTLML